MDDRSGDIRATRPKKQTHYKHVCLSPSKELLQVSSWICIYNIHVHVYTVQFWN